MKLITYFSLMFFSIFANAGDEKKEWVIQCQKDKFTDAVTCTTTKKFPEWQGGTPSIPIVVAVTKLGYIVIFSYHDHPIEMAKIRIDSNEALIQKTNIIIGERANKLINQMQTGSTGSISSRVWKDITHDFDFSLLGFSESYLKLNEAFKNYK
jgi:hypothetical protein